MKIRTNTKENNDARERKQKLMFKAKAMKNTAVSTEAKLRKQMNGQKGEKGSKKGEEKLCKRKITIRGE